MQKVYQILSNINTIIINPLILLAFGVALVVFLYGVFEYIWKSRSNPQQIKTGTNHMLWGIVGMFIMISVFGIFRFLLNTVPAGERTKTNVERVIDINN